MSKQKILIVVVVVLLLVVAVVRVAKNRPGGVYGSLDDSRVQIVTSFYPLYFFANEIAGEKARVTNITPAGGEPHDYDPSPQDIARIEKSKLLILNGGGLETWGEKIKTVVDPNQTHIVIVGEDIINKTVADTGNTIVDPHIWLAPPLAEQVVEKIKLGIEQVDPINAAYYDARAKSLTSKLSDLDLLYQHSLASCTNRTVVTAHAAFGYLTTTYHLEQVPIAGLSPDAEPSPRQLGDIIQIAKKNNVKYIFFESLASPKLSETIAREIGAKTLVLNPIEGLTPAQIENGQDYFSVMRANLANLEIACR